MHVDPSTMWQDKSESTRCRHVYPGYWELNIVMFVHQVEKCVCLPSSEQKLQFLVDSRIPSDTFRIYACTYLIWTKNNQYPHLQVRIQVP